MTTRQDYSHYTLEAGVLMSPWQDENGIIISVNHTMITELCILHAQLGIPEYFRTYFIIDQKIYKPSFRLKLDFTVS